LRSRPQSSRWMRARSLLLRTILVKCAGINKAHFGNSRFRRPSQKYGRTPVTTACHRCTMLDSRWPRRRCSSHDSTSAIHRSQFDWGRSAPLCRLEKGRTRATRAQCTTARVPSCNASSVKSQLQHGHGIPGNWICAMHLVFRSHNLIYRSCQAHAFPRRNAPELCCHLEPSRMERAQGRPGARMHPRPPRKKLARKRVDHRYRRSPTGLPCAVVYGL
jgi:hypothetical protein